MCCVSVAPGMLLARDWTCSSLKPLINEHLVTVPRRVCVSRVAVCAAALWGARHTPHTRRTRARGARALVRVTGRPQSGRRLRAKRAGAGALAPLSALDGVHRSGLHSCIRERVDRRYIPTGCCVTTTYIHRSMRAGSRSYTAHVQKNHGRRHSARESSLPPRPVVSRARRSEQLVQLMRMVSEQPREDVAVGEQREARWRSRA